MELNFNFLSLNPEIRQGWESFYAEDLKSGLDFEFDVIE